MRILVIRRGAIGDTIVTLPALGILRENYPDACIEIIGNREYWEIAHNRYYINAVSSGEIWLTYELYSRDGRPSKEVVDYFSSFDLILAYINDPEGIVSGNLRKIGAKSVLICPPFPRGDNEHAADYTALILREINLDVNLPLFPKIYLSREDLDFSSQFLSHFMEYQPLVAIHPRTFGPKGWAIEKFINVGRWIEDILNGKPIWIMGPAEEENIKLIRSNFPSSPVLQLYSLPKVAAVLSLSHLYFGCDTGISHLAAAVGARVLTLFGPTNPQVWCPRGKKVLIIKAEEMFKIQEDEVKDIIATYINE
ncbi:MAG: glycosyltransferase family 9 protein [Ignavibacteriales bacterium]